MIHVNVYNGKNIVTSSLKLCDKKGAFLVFRTLVMIRAFEGKINNY